MKIRIFALAKDLGLDSKDLIQTCRDAGLDVKASPLASISEDERDMILARLEEKGSSAAQVESEDMDVQTPIRDETGKGQGSGN